MNQEEYIIELRTLQANNYCELCTHIFVKAAKLSQKAPHLRKQIDRRAKKVLNRMLKRHPERYGHHG